MTRFLLFVRCRHFDGLAGIEPENLKGGFGTATSTGNAETRATMEIISGGLTPLWACHAPTLPKLLFARFRSGFRRRSAPVVTGGNRDAS